MIFNFIIGRLGFFKHIPFVPDMFEALLLTHSFLCRREVIGYIEAIEEELSGWKHITVTRHKYGGMQFNFDKKEIGHIHGNGLLDMPLSMQEHDSLIANQVAEDHHHFRNSGWISKFIRNESELKEAIGILRAAYIKRLSTKVTRR